MKNKKLYAGAVIIAALVGGFLLWRGAATPLPLEQPLFFTVEELQSLTAKQQKQVADFKKKALARVTFNIPLTEQERSVLGMSIATTTMLPLPGGVVTANQDIYRFTAEELRLIEEALHK